MEKILIRLKELRYDLIEKMMEKQKIEEHAHVLHHLIKADKLLKNVK